MNISFEVKDSSIQGRGVFSSEPIESGRLICRMQGETIDIGELKRRYLSGTERSCDPLQVSKTKYLDMQEPYVLINHSCEPNCEIVNECDLVALRNTGVGEELTYNYSLTEWSDDDFWSDINLWSDPWEESCKCQSKNCRGKMGEFRFLPVTEQNYYLKNGWVTNHIKEISKSHGY